MKAIIVDDEILAIQMLESLLLEIGNVDILATFTKPEDAMRALETLTVDIIFLDMEMGSMHGVEFAEILNVTNANPKVVFVTAHAQYAVEAFDVQAFDYLLKPIQKKRLEETLQRLEKTLQSSEQTETNEPYLYVRAMDNFQLYSSPTEEVKWRTRKVKELFAYLWHHYPNPVPRSYIMEDLWREQHIDSAVQLMHTSFYHLRKTIKDSGFDNPVLFSNEQYTLDVPVKSDLCELTKLMKERQPTNAQIEKMIDIYKENYLEEDNYEWALAKQERVKRTFLSTLENFAEEKMAQNDLSHTVATALEKMVELDPYNERFVYLLIDYYGKTKNLQKVIKTAGEFEDLFKKELGIAIPKEISSIYYKYVTEKIS